MDDQLFRPILKNGFNNSILISSIHPKFSEGDYELVRNSIWKHVKLCSIKNVYQFSFHQWFVVVKQVKYIRSSLAGVKCCAVWSSFLVTVSGEHEKLGDHEFVRDVDHVLNDKKFH